MRCESEKVPDVMGEREGGSLLAEPESQRPAEVREVDESDAECGNKSGVGDRCQIYLDLLVELHVVGYSVHGP